MDTWGDVHNWTQINSSGLHLQYFSSLCHSNEMFLVFIVWRILNRLVAEMFYTNKSDYSWCNALRWWLMVGCCSPLFSALMQAASWSCVSSCASPCWASSSSRTTFLKSAYRKYPSTWDAQNTSWTAYPPRSQCVGSLNHRIHYVLLLSWSCLFHKSFKCLVYRHFPQKNPELFKPIFSSDYRHGLCCSE